MTRKKSRAHVGIFHYLHRGHHLTMRDFVYYFLYPPISEHLVAVNEFAGQKSTTDDTPYSVRGIYIFIYLQQIIASIVCSSFKLISFRV